MPGQISGYKETLQTIKDLRKLKENQPTLTQGGLEPNLKILRDWQAARLARTHADLLASARYGPACSFFLSDMYAARDFSRRDQDLEYLYSLMSHFMPEILLRLVSRAIEINNLTKTLDQVLLKVLVEDLGMTDEITVDMYAEAYRMCDNYNDRVHQINLLGEIGRMVELGTHIPLISSVLKLSRRPATNAGWGEIHSFLERGYLAFKHIHGSDKFLRILQERELRILDRIYEGFAQPFDI
jgi:hypothetical protein